MPCYDRPLYDEPISHEKVNNVFQKPMQKCEDNSQRHNKHDHKKVLVMSLCFMIRVWARIRWNNRDPNPKAGLSILLCHCCEVRSADPADSRCRWIPQEVHVGIPNKLPCYHDFRSTLAQNGTGQIHVFYMAELVVYGRDSCGLCNKFKESCEAQGLKYTPKHCLPVKSVEVRKPCSAKVATSCLNLRALGPPVILFISLLLQA